MLFFWGVHRRYGYTKQTNYKLIDIGKRCWNSIPCLWRTGNRVVIKQFKTHFGSSFAGVKRENRTLQNSAVTNPKIFGYFWVIEQRRLPHLVMEYKEGENLEPVWHSNFRCMMCRNLTDSTSLVLYTLFSAISHPPGHQAFDLLVQEDGRLVLIDF